MKHALITSAIALGLLAGACTTPPPDVLVMCSNGYRAVMQDLARQYAISTSQPVGSSFDLSANLARRIEAGEPFDVAILTPALIESLTQRGFLMKGSSVPLAVSPIGVAIRAGTAKRDVQSLDAIRQTLLAASSIAYAREGAASGFFRGLLEKLALAEPLKDKVRPLASGAEVTAAVRAGDVELGVIPISEILPVEGIEVGGSFPDTLGGSVTMVSAVSQATKHEAAARSLVAFLSGSAAAPVLQLRGMTPPR